MNMKWAKSILKYYPMTMIIILISAFIFFLHILGGEYGNYDQSSILVFGGFNKELINNGEVWRLFTYTFGHMSSFHFMINIPILIVVSKSVERMYGSIKFLLLFLIITGIAGLSTYLFYNGPYLTLAGLSGTGYGFAGILTLHMLRKPQSFSQGYRLFLFFMLLFGVYSVFNTSAGIANSAHIGGFVSGLILAFIVPTFQCKKNISKV